MSAALLIPALVLDATLGEPKWLWSRFPHPAVLMGRAVGWTDRTFNAGPNRRLKGAVAMGALAIVAGCIGAVIAALPDGGVLEIVCAAILLAQRSLVEHVRAVGDALRLSLGDGRRTVARIVGRDTTALDEPGVARAAIESAAENLSDGVVAPALFFLIFGLPGMMIYKITNTADSMIGHRTPRHEEFGWAAARLDDVLNWVPARVTALLIAVTHRWFDRKPILRDGPLHRSPNAGWPEAAMAVALDVALSGPRSYHGEALEFPWVWPEGRIDPGPDDIEAACAALWRVWAALLAATMVIALF